MRKKVLIGGASAVLALAASVVTLWEGKENAAYLDPVGIPTICYGHTHGVTLGQVHSDSKCEKLLESELKNAQVAVERQIRTKLAPETKAALISFTYNLGEGWLAKSTLRQKMNAGDIVGGCNELMRFIYAGGKPLHGLALRRADERALCLEGAS